MADNKHIDSLNQGVLAWNAWRQANPSIRPDLSGHNMQGADLSNIDFGFTNLANVNLSEADLTGANLENANLKESYLEGCSLGEACLDYVILESADLVRAFMVYCSLNGANLRKADLAMAILSSAVLDNAILDEAQLYDTQTSRWSIKDVRCSGVYWDSEGKVLTEYYPGEFEKLHGDTISVSIMYNGGISQFQYFTLPLLLKHINQKHPDTPIELKSIETIPGKSTEATIVVYETNGKDPNELLQELEVLSDTLPKLQNALVEQRHITSMLSAMNDQLSKNFSKIVKELPNMSGDKYTILGGNQGVIGSHGHAEHLTQNSNHSQQLFYHIDTESLAHELEQLAISMQNEASSLSHDSDIREIKAAQETASKGDASSTTKHLKKAGRWALDVATKVGLELATEAIKKSLGI